MSIFGRVLLTMGIVLAVSAGPGLTGAEAQSIVDRYMAEQYRAHAMEIIERNGRTIEPRPVRRLPTAADSLLPEGQDDRPARATAREEANPEANPREAFSIDDRRVVRRLERSWFESAFEDVHWSFLGATSERQMMDTTYTRELRARLEAQFGAPTQTLADRDLGESLDEYVQFEYWIVANDSIPIKIMDPHGPFDRGLVTVTDAEYRDSLRELRRAVLAPIIESEERAPYVDYYFDIESDQWYRTGFDGETYFREAIRRSEITEGRRPQLDS